ncbi:MAG TPA: hypothetical protein VGF75_05570 [Candidatus Saccharimonadales bacterium]|jgi:hypothetical protein
MTTPAHPLTPLNDPELYRLLHKPEVSQQQTPTTKTTPVTSTQSSTKTTTNNWNPEWNNNAAQLQQRARITQVSSSTNKDPLSAKDPLDRQAGVYAKALRIVNNPKFKNGSPRLKEDVLNTYYNNYVIPAYTWANVAAPHPDVWKKGVLSGSMSVDDFYLNRGHGADAASDLKSTILNTGASASRFFGNFINGAIVAGVKADEHVFGLKAYFNAPKSELDAKAANDPRARLALQEREFLHGANGLMKENQAAIDSANFWFEMRPSKTFSEKTGSFVGEQAAQLPLYEAMSAVRLSAETATIDKVLAGAAAPTAASGRVAQAANFTRRLAATSAGRFIGRRLGEAADGYITSAIQNQDSKQSAASAMSFVVLGTMGEGLEATAKITRTAMKRQLAHDVSIGGLPYVKAVGDQAMHEMSEGIIGHDAAGNEIKVPPGTKPEDIHAAVEHVLQNDPVKAKAVTAAKISLSQIAREMHGEGTLWRNLSHSQRDAVRLEYAKRTAEAAEEIPIHVPEVAHHEAQQSIKESVAQSPKAKQTIDAINTLGKDVGITVENAVVQTEQDAVKDKTGVRSVQGATYKAANVTREFHQEIKNPVKREDVIFNELRHSGNLRYNSGDQAYNVKFASKVDKALYNLNVRAGTDMAKNRTRMLNQAEDLKRLRSYFPGKSDQDIYAMAQDVKAQLDAEIKERRPRYNADPEEGNVLFPAKYEESVTAAKEPEPRHYVSFKVDALAPMRNTFNKAAAKSSQSLESYLKGMDNADFVEEVKDQTGHAIHFEKPFDLMLWAFHNSDDIPKAVSNKILGWLKDEDPTQTIESLRKQAKILDHHIELLAYSGRLDSEGNVFRSTVTSAWKDRTRWQRELLQDVSTEEVSEYSRTMRAFKTNWPQEYNDGLAMLLKLQTLRNKAKTLEGAISHTDDIRDIIMKKPGGKP